jgi:large subunit ribosomal protein L1
MGQVAKSLGQYLGPRGKLPRPIVGNIAPIIEKSKKSIRMVSKGKYLPVAQAFVGTENMSVDDLTENIETVYDAVKTKVSEGNIKSVYIKLTMGAPIRVL